MNDQPQSNRGAAPRHCPQLMAISSFFDRCATHLAGPALAPILQLASTLAADRGRWSRIRAGRTLAATLALLLLVDRPVGQVVAAEPPPALRQVRIRTLYSRTLLSDVSQNDALASVKVWTESIGRNQGFQVQAEPSIFGSLEEAEKRIQENTLDIVILDSLEYLRLSQTAKVDPVFVGGRLYNSSPDDYVLVTRRDRDLATLRNLRGKSVLLFKIGGNWGRIWMDGTLWGEGLSSVDDLFASSTEVAKASSVILPVFFGKYDAGVVKRRSLNTMAELNPQLATQLQVVTNSPCFPETVICIHQEFKEFRNDLLRSLAVLHLDPKGQQLLMMFKIDKLERFKPEYFDAARDLLEQQTKARNQPPRTAAAEDSGGRPKP